MPDTSTTVRWNNLSTAELQHLFVALLTSPMDHDLTRALRAEVAFALDERLDVRWSSHV